MEPSSRAGGFWLLEPGLDSFQYHLIKAPQACLLHCLLHFEHQHYSHIAKTALKLLTAEDAGDIGLPHPFFLLYIAGKQPLPGAPILD